MSATADRETELSSCCDALVTYHDYTLICKACYGECDWA